MASRSDEKAPPPVSRIRSRAVVPVKLSRMEWAVLVAAVQASKVVPGFLLLEDEIQRMVADVVEQAGLPPAPVVEVASGT